MNAKTASIVTVFEIIVKTTLTIHAEERRERGFPFFLFSLPNVFFVRTEGLGLSIRKEYISLSLSLRFCRDGEDNRSGHSPPGVLVKQMLRNTTKGKKDRRRQERKIE